MWALLDVAFFLIAVLVHAALGRVSLNLSAVVRFLLVGGMLGLALAAVLLMLFGINSRSLAGVLVYMLACELYIFLFTLVHSSISAITLRRLFVKSMTPEALDELCNPARMTDARLAKLTANGFLVEDAGRFCLTSRAERMIAMFARLRRFFRHDRRISGANVWQAEVSGQDARR